jgi:hypothetical protein
MYRPKVYVHAPRETERDPDLSLSPSGPVKRTYPKNRRNLARRAGGSKGTKTSSTLGLEAERISLEEQS